MNRDLKTLTELKTSKNQDVQIFLEPGFIIGGRLVEYKYFSHKKDFTEIKIGKVISNKMGLYTVTKTKIVWVEYES